MAYESRLELSVDSRKGERNLKRFSGELDKVDRRGATAVGRVTTLGKSMKRTALAAGAFATAVGGAAAGMAYYVKTGLDAVDAQAKLARQLDSTIGGLRGLQLAANDAGVETGVINSAMERFSARLGEAQRGTGQTAEALDRLNLNAAELAGMDVDERVATIADRVQELGYSGAQTAYVLRQFGIRNREIVNLMRQGGDAVRQARGEIEDYGLAVSEVDAAAVEAANDALSRTGMVTESVRNAIATELAPIILVIAENFNKSARAAGGWGEVVTSAMRGAAGAVGPVLDAMDWLGNEIDEADLLAQKAGASMRQEMLNLAATIAEKPVEAVNLLGVALSKLPGVDDIDILAQPGWTQGLRGLANKAAVDVSNLSAQLMAVRDGIKPSEKINRVLDESEQRMAELREEIEQSTNSTNDNSLANETNATSSAKATQQTDQFGQSLRALTEELFPAEAQQSRFRQEQLLLQQAFTSGRIGIDRYLESWQRLQEQQSRQQGDAANRLAGGEVNAPSFGGIAGSVGGPLGEMGKIEQAQQKQQEWYAQQMEQLAQFRQQRADLTQQWDAREREIKQEHESRLSNIEQARQTVMLKSAESAFGSVTDITRQFAGEQSGIYQTMFAVQKAAAIAQSIVAIQQGIAMAAANPWPANLGAMASVAAATAGIVSNIASVAAPSGQAHDGIDSVPADGTWNLQKGERVTTSETSAKLDKTLDEVKRGNGGGGVTVNLIEDKSRAGQTKERKGKDDQQEIDVFVADIMGDGPRSQAVRNKFGLTPQGR